MKIKYIQKFKINLPIIIIQDILKLAFIVKKSFNIMLTLGYI